MAFPVPDHLPRKAPSHDVSSQIIAKIADATNKLLTADLAKEWISELELSIQQTKDRIYERIHEELPDFERQLVSSRFVQTRLRDLSTSVDLLSDSLANPETGLLPTLLYSLKAHAELAQHASNARTVHDSLSYLSRCSREFEELTALVGNGKLPEGVSSSKRLLGMLEDAPEALAKADVMVGMKQELRALRDRVEEQLSEAYSRSIRISSTEFQISSSVQVRQSRIMISLHDVLSSLSAISLDSYLASLRRDIVTYFIDFPLQQAVSTNISRAPDANGAPSICLSLLSLPPQPDFRKSAIDYLKTLFDFLFSHLFSALPPSISTSFPQSLYRPTASAILEDVLIPSLPSSLSALPPFLALVRDAVRFEQEYFHERFLGDAASQGEGDIEAWARNATAHYGRKRRMDLLAAARALILSAGSGPEERVVRVEVAQESEEDVETRRPEVIPVQDIGSEDKDDGENGWDFDDSVRGAGGGATVNGASKPSEESKSESEVDENGWDFEDVEDSTSVPDPPDSDPELPKGDDEAQDDSYAWGWGDSNNDNNMEEGSSTLAPSGDDDKSSKTVSYTNGHKVNEDDAPRHEESEGAAWDDAWDESLPKPSPPSPTQSLTPAKPPKLAKRLEKFSKKGKEKGLASPGLTSSSPSSPFPASAAFPPSVSSMSFHASNSLSPVSSSQPLNLHQPPSRLQAESSKPVVSLPLKPKAPETYLITGRARELVRLIADVLSEGRDAASSTVFSTFRPTSPSPDASASSLPSTLILQAAPSVLDLYRAIYPVTYSVELTRSERALRFANDCAYVGGEVAKLHLPDSAASTVADHMRESLERLRELGAWWFDEGVERQRERVLQVLSRAEGFVDTGDQERFDECEGVMSEVLRSVRAVANQWKTVLRRTKYYRATGQVVEALLTKILADVLALPDIPELDSRRLSELCRILNALEGLFVDADDPVSKPSMVLAYVPSWLKYSYLSELLEASIADIGYLFDEGALIDFQVSELVNLVRALFAETPLRANTIAKLQRGHPVAVE